MNKSDQTNIRFQEVIDALLDDNADFPAEYFLAFSDIEGENLDTLISVWPQITPERKVKLVENLEIINETNTLVNFNEIARIGMNDANGIVRAGSIRILWEYEDERLIPVLIDFLKKDADLSVRAQAAAALGKYVYLGEVDEIRPENLENVVDVLLSVMQSKEADLVRQKSLESLGFSSRDEVNGFIFTAYQSPDYDWVSSALLAMGRSADEKWGEQVLPMLAHPELRIQKEAVKAAGELELQAARKMLLRKALEKDQVDEDLWVVSIWALSKIGGEGVQEVFEKLLDLSETDEEHDFLQEALDNLYLTEGVLRGFDLLDLEGDESEFMHEVSTNEEIDLDQLQESWLEQLENKMIEDLDMDDELDSDYEDED